MSHIVVYTDGGSRGNPGPAAYGFVVMSGDVILYESGQEIGIATNNVAEYAAIEEALRWIVDNREKIGEFSVIEMRMDSLLACQQLKGVFAIKKAHLASSAARIHELEKRAGIPVRYTHVRRELNTRADALVNAALDRNSAK